MFCWIHKNLIQHIILVMLILPLYAYTQSQRPNIIYIMTDDMGYGDLSCYGRKDYTTPHLDKLALQGVKFMNAYTGGPMCTPTRTSFMTGRYPARTPVGLHEPLVQKDSLAGLTSNYPSIATFMKKSGYSTHLVGKWHLGFLPEMSPIRNGFEEYFGYNSGGIDHISHTNVLGQNDLYENETPLVKKGYLTELFAERTIDIIRRRHTKPFFISLMFSAPHWPLQAPGDTAYALGREQWQQGGTPEKYAAMMKSLDDAIGNIMQTLEQENLAKNTVIIFTSDNGGEKFGYNGIYQKGKFHLWEGGIRTAAFIRWPGKIPANTVTQQVAITMDWTATILAVAKIKADQKFPLDGIDLMPVCKGKTKEINRTLYWRVFQRNQQKAIRDSDYKYLKDEKGEYLFNLKKDPAEKQNLKEKEKIIFERLKQKYADWEKTVLPPIPL